MSRLAKDRAALALLTMAVALTLVFFRLAFPAGKAGGSLELEVLPGMSFNAATRTLKEEGLVRDPRLFSVLARVTGLHKRLRPGTYTFTGRLSALDVFGVLSAGGDALSGVTIREGDNLVRIGRRLQDEGIINSARFQEAATDPALLNSLAIDAPSVEGYLFPDTYIFDKGISETDVIKVMVRRFREVVGQDLALRAEAIGFTENGLLTLASIVEMEARVDHERPIISAVYHNRLKRGMRLQADPTSVYGIKPISAGINYDDLRRRTPYNTYVIRGLPPGPIASPGLKSIQAAMYPDDVPYIFFVSNNDGTHTFTESLKRHRQAIKAYRIKRSISKSKVKRQYAPDGS